MNRFEAIMFRLYGDDENSREDAYYSLLMLNKYNKHHIEKQDNSILRGLTGSRINWQWAASNMFKVQRIQPIEFKQRIYLNGLYDSGNTNEP